MTAVRDKQKADGFVGRLFKVVNKDFVFLREESVHNLNELQ